MNLSLIAKGISGAAAVYGIYQVAFSDEIVGISMLVLGLYFLVISDQK